MRYTILTYIINNYEKVLEIEEKDPEAEYILVTDDPHLHSETWSVIYDEELDGLGTFEKCYSIRFNCFKYATTNICVRIDGCIKLKRSIKPLIDIFEDEGFDFALMPHPVRDNFIEEYAIWVKQRGYSRQQADHCINILRKKGYDFSYKGMFQGCFAIQRKSKLTEDIDKMSFSLLKELGINGNIERIDQIPVSYILNTYYNHLKILPVSEQILRSAYMQWYLHNSDTPNLFFYYDLTKDDEHYMFNKIVKCMYLRTPLDDISVSIQERELQEYGLKIQGENASLNHLLSIEKANNTQKEEIIGHLTQQTEQLKKQLEKLSATITDRTNSIKDLTEKIKNIKKHNQLLMYLTTFLIIVLFITLTHIISSL